MVVQISRAIPSLDTHLPKRQKNKKNDKKTIRQQKERQKDNQTTTKKDKMTKRK